VTDVGGVALLGYAAFRLATVAAGCKDQGSCPQLTPLILLFVVLALLLYFGLAALLWRSTLGQRAFSPDGDPAEKPR
jgi:hypothetical protein